MNSKVGSGTGMTYQWHKNSGYKIKKAADSYKC